jgi:hypothetical protein
MAARRSSWLKLLLVIGVAFGAGKLWMRFFNEDEAVKRLVNQLWIERLPRDQRDMVYVAALVEHEGRRVGVVGRGSRWRSHQDAFLWRLDQDQLHTRFPQDDKRYTLRIRTWECEGQAPRPFQLCLEARRGDQVLRFFSKKEWVIRPHADGALPPDIAGLAPRWEGALEAAQDAEVGDGADAEGWGPFGQSQ